jgi:D-serine deaminase-like pyridoxal phosphate-dependent protein
MEPWKTSSYGAKKSRIEVTTMEFFVEFWADRPYRISSADELPSPCLLVFRDRFESNIIKMQELLSSISPGFGFTALWPHVKTHKSIWATRKLMEAGFSSFKTTPNEVDMLVEAGVRRMFVAYPLTSKEAHRIARVAHDHPEIEIVVQAARPIHADCLAGAAEACDIQWQYFIDLDVGMHRTGIPPEAAFDFYQSVKDNKRLNFAGFHGYDGHNTSLDIEERRKTTRASVDQLVELFRQFEKENIAIPKLMMGGTPSFLTDLEYLAHVNLNTELILSPGTWVYFDTMDRAILPDSFEIAVAIAAQVMDRPAPGKATLNLGYKRWGIDQGAVEGFSIDGMTASGWSEEHTVVTVPENAAVSIGDYVLILPRHVCSTINLWEHFTVIGPDGAIEIRDCPIEARNR